MVTTEKLAPIVSLPVVADGKYHTYVATTTAEGAVEYEIDGVVKGAISTEGADVTAMLELLRRLRRDWVNCLCKAGASEACPEVEQDEEGEVDCTCVCHPIGALLDKYRRS